MQVTGSNPFLPVRPVAKQELQPVRYQTEHESWQTAPADILKKIFVGVLGHIPVLRAVCRRYRAITDGILSHYQIERRAPRQYLACMAAETGAISLLEWLKSLHMPFYVAVAAAAARGGQVHTLVWLQKNGAYFDFTAFEEAAYHGKTEALEWLETADVPKPGWEGNRVSLREIIVQRAAEGSHEHIFFKYFNFVPDEIFKQRLIQSVTTGPNNAIWQNPKILKLIDPQEQCARALNEGNLKMLQWLREKGYPWGDFRSYDFRSLSLRVSANQNDYVAAAEWAKKNGWQPHLTNWKGAQLQRRYALLKWLEKNNCPKPKTDDEKQFYFNDAVSGRLWPCVIQSIHLWNSYVMERICSAGDRKMMEWVKKNKPEELLHLSDDDIVEYTVTSRDMSLLDERKIVVETTSLACYVFASGTLPFFKKMVAKGNLKLTDDVYLAAFRLGCLGFLQEFFHQKYQFTDEKHEKFLLSCTLEAIQRQQIHVLDWIVKQN